MTWDIRHKHSGDVYAYINWFVFGYNEVSLVFTTAGPDNTYRESMYLAFNSTAWYTPPNWCLL